MAEVADESANSPLPPPNEEENKKHARELVTLVLVEAVGSSLTPFVPIPFVDDFLVARLFRRITRKVIEQRGAQPADKPLVKAIVEGYIREGTPPLHERALAGAARFIVRKVAIILDVKKSHDVFGEAIVYALALDAALDVGVISESHAMIVGGAMYRSAQAVGSAALEVLSRAGRDAFVSAEASSGGSGESSRLTRVSDAIGKHVDNTRMQLVDLMHHELARS